MTKRNLVLLALALVMLTVAAWFLINFFKANEDIPDQVFFYDLSEKKLFTAPRTAVPPIKGINGIEEDGMRAVVVSTSGKPQDKSSWKIAYLEMYSPQLKQQMEAAQTGGPSPGLGRSEAQSHRYVRRPSEGQWHPMNSGEAQQILTAWTQPGPNGVVPIICTP